MTNQTQFKEDTESLFKMVHFYKSRYRFMSDGKNPKPLDVLEKELRLVLQIVRTDEENSAQTKRDGML